MANDVNKPRGGRRGDASSLGQVFRRVAQAARPGVEETKLQAIQDALQTRMEDLQDRIENVRQTGEDVENLMKEIASVGGPLTTVETQLAGFAAGRVTKIQKVTQQQFGKFAGERASAQRMRAIGQRPGTYGQASALSGQVSHSALLQQQEYHIGRAQELRETLVEKAGQLPQERLEMIAGGILEHEQKGAVTGAAIAAQRRRGETTQQIHEQGLKLTSAVIQERRRSEIVEGVVAGAGGTQRERNLALEKATDNLVKTFESFNAALEDGTSNLNEMEDSYKVAQKTFKESQIAAGAGPGGGGIGSWLMGATGQAVTAGGAALFNTVGINARMFGVELPARRTELQAGFADLANRQYRDFRSAGGEFDFASARRLAFYNTARDKGSITAAMENTALAAEGVGGVFSSLGGVAGGIAGGNIGAAISGGAAGINNAIRASALALSGIPAAERKLQQINLGLTAGDAVNYQRDANIQDFIDFTMQTGVATRGLGGGRAGTLTSLLNEGGINRLAGLGIRPGQIAGLTRSGVGALGAEFMGAGTLGQAGAAQQAGLLTAEQFIGQAGALSMMGGGGADRLEKIMQNAVATGMDNSKNIQQMVSATISLSADLAGAGLDVSGGQANILAAAATGLSSLGVNQRTMAAANAAAFVDKVGRDRESNIFTVLRSARTRGITAGRGVSNVEFEAAITTPLSVLREIERLGETSGAANKVTEAGLFKTLIDPQTGNVDPKQLEKMIEISKRGILEQTFKFKLDPGLMKRVTESMNVPEGELDPEIRSLFAGAGLTAGGAGVAGLGVRGILRGKIGGRARGGLQIGVGEGGPEEISGAAIEEAVTTQAQTQTKTLTTGMKEMGANFKDALSETNKLFSKIKDVFDPKTMQLNAAEAAKKFDPPAIKFGAATDNFTTAVAAFEALINNDFENNPELRKSWQLIRKNAANKEMDGAKPK